VTRNKGRTGKSDKPSKRAVKSKPPESTAGARNALLRSKPLIAVAGAIMAIAIGGLALLFVARGGFGLSEASRANAAVSSFVGSGGCADCHRTETALWNGSQH